MNDEQDLVPVFMPSLGAVLIAAEDKKGEPLTLDEAIAIRDNAACIMMESSDVAKMVESRGYLDIDPENCWYDWQMLRRDLGRKPDLDPGARVQFVRNDDADFRATVIAAQASLQNFRDMSIGRDPSTVMLKTCLSDSFGRSFVWLFNVECSKTGFTAEIFELPPPLQEFSIGDRIEINSEDVMDWMINADGTLYGGYSIRYQRETLSDHERTAFDEHIGVTKYA